MSSLLSVLLLALVLPPAGAQHEAADRIELPGLDVVLSGAEDLMLRAADQDVDGLYQAVLAASQSDRDASRLCALFDPTADRSLAGLQRVASALDPDSRARFADAALAIAVSGMQGPLRPYDPVIADQVLRRAAVTAALIHDGFSAGMAATGRDPGSREARCRSFRQLVDVLKDFALADRAAATRYLMLEGLAGLDAAE